MSYLEFLLRSPRFWALLAALFLGGALSRVVLIFLARDRRPEVQRRRVTTLFLAMAVAVVAFTAGIFVPPGYGIFDVPVLLFGAYALGGAGVLFSLFRYLIAPVALIVGLCIVAAIYLNAPWQSVRTETPIVRVRVIAVEGGDFSLEVLEPETEGDAWILDGAGTGFAPEVEILRYHPGYVLLGRATAARLTGLVSYRRGQGDSPAWREAERYPVSPRTAIAGDRVVDLARRVLRVLPGITVRRLEPEPRAVRLLDHYRVVVAPDGAVTFERVR